MTIAGRYQPLEDAPGAGAPFRARDLATAQTVLLRPVRRMKPEAVPAALAHALRFTGIFHPSLVTLFDAFEGAQEPIVLAYESVTARTVRAVAGGQPFNARRAAEIACEVCDAASELHARGLAHGTIDSDTVLITAKGKTKLDRVGDPTLEGTTDATPAADVSAIGRLLMELLVGRRGASLDALQDDPVSRLAVRVAEGDIAEAAVLAALLRENSRLGA